MIEVLKNRILRMDINPILSKAITDNIIKSETTDGSTYLWWEYPEASQAVYHLDSHLPLDGVPAIPSPMLRDYHWPGVFPSIFEHQKTTASFLSLRYRAFCFNEAGTGKSASCAWAADYLMGLGLIKRVLIICPLSIMYTAWQADIFKTVMHRSAGVAYGDRKKREKVINSVYDFTIINYDGLGVCFNAVAAQSYDLIIVDEANAYKNASTKRWKTLAKLIMPSTRLWMLTGTPASQSPCDAYGIAKMVSPHRVPKFMTAWKDRVMHQVTKFKYIPKATATGDVFRALQPAIRFTKKECLDLPDIIYETRDVPLTPQVVSYYKRLKSQLLIEAAGESISAVNAAAAMSKLLQISGGAVYTDDHNIVEFDVTPRLNVLEEALEEASHKVIIFVPYLHTIETLQKFLTIKGYSNDTIQGSVTGKNRAEIITRFQNNPDPRVLIAQPQTMSHGVTLTAADTIIHWSPVTSVETFIQCNARIDRVGQVNKMLVVLLQGSDVERKTYQMLMGKLGAHHSLVDLYRQTLEE